MATIDELAASLQLSEEEKRQAQSMALMQVGFGLLGGRRGHELETISRAGQQGLFSYRGELDDARRNKLHGLQARGTALDIASKESQYNDAELMRKQQLEFAQRFGGNGGGQLAPQRGGDSAQPQQLGGTGSAMSLSVQPEAGYAPDASRGAPPGGVPSKREVAQRYQGFGDYWMSLGRPEKAQQYYDLAQKTVPQIKEQKTLTQNGKRVTVNLYNDGSHEILPDVGPDMEKAHFLDTGAQIGAVDPFTGQPVAGGGRYNKQMTPGETASNRVAQGNLDVARGNLGLSRERFNFDQAKERAAPKLPADATKAIEDARDQAARANQLADLGTQFSTLNKRQATGSSIDKAPYLPTFNESKQSMEGITAALVPLNRQAGSGTMSDKDAEMFERAMPSIKKDRKVNDGLVQGMEMRRQLANDRVAFLEQYVQSKGTALGADQLWRQYLNANPIFDARSNPINPTVNADRQSWQEHFSGAKREAPKQSPSKGLTVDALEAEMRRRGLGQ